MSKEKQALLPFDKTGDNNEEQTYQTNLSAPSDEQHNVINMSGFRQDREHEEHMNKVREYLDCFKIFAD